MKYLLPLLLLLTTLTSNAAPPPCDPTQPYSTTTPYMRFIAKDYYQRVAEGWFVFVACKDPTTKLWSLHGGACRHGVCNQSDWAKAMIEFGMAVGDEAKKSSFQASWDKIILETCEGAPTDPLDAPICERYRAKRDEIGLALNEVKPPPPITHKVRVNGTSPTRPTYPYTNGVRGTTASPERATVGADCILATGDYGRFGPEFRNDRVALCSPK